LTLSGDFYYFEKREKEEKEMAIWKKKKRGGGALGCLLTGAWRGRRGRRVSFQSREEKGVRGNPRPLHCLVRRAKLAEKGEKREVCPIFGFALTSDRKLRKEKGWAILPRDREKEEECSGNTSKISFRT